MSRTTRRLAALAMIPAALTGAAATPAVGASGAVSVIGIAYERAFYRGPADELKDVGSTCTAIPPKGSAVNHESSGHVITFYLGTQCQIPFAVLNPGQSDRNIGELPVRAYTTTPE
ncbi:hypothetical protein GCM10010387_62090 [Streptomyces inusitatus]|uniref:Secreted protein n=1 Tax=Streptomyces inusitatus TaxID=68221 RepID=A0A918V2L7_9ACTN|nr:hypothetical protein [Streptomyces inusitatus]GGZ59903.1 hypothetical protein GCM10010387_62090 [Streptomyces inusitatus]